jgi:catechol 2,3-dioxygenase-like lactoylglutathione lyase family enzyme
MLDHVSIGVADLKRTKKFYDAALKPLGYKCLSESAESLGYGDKGVMLWISPAKHPVKPDMQSGLHFCFAAPIQRLTALSP